MSVCDRRERGGGHRADYMCPLSPRPCVDCSHVNTWGRSYFMPSGHNQNADHHRNHPLHCVTHYFSQEVSPDCVSRSCCSKILAPNFLHVRKHRIIHSREFERDNRLFLSPNLTSTLKMIWCSGWPPFNFLMTCLLQYTQMDTHTSTQANTLQTVEVNARRVP